ncbi:hypothetical protein KFE98_06765 [bacterium SCSIO 12741]|nr:hypothetical protein KFE98_06765 [bacterium SCSIO 12741]
MKRIICAFVALGGILFAQGQGFRMEWAQGIGNLGNNGTDQTFQIASDSKGNVFFTGYYSNTVDFNPSPQVIENRTSHGNKDLFILKLDSTGTFKRVLTTGGRNTDQTEAISIDANDHVYLAGYFLDTSDFDPGPAQDLHISNGLTDAFILKLDSSGQLIRAHSFGGQVMRI